MSIFPNSDICETPAMTAKLTKQTHFDAIIIGGGACGLMCAVQAGFLGKHTLVLEKNDKVGAKILISGGGRCNYTNLYTSAQQFISQNEHFCKSALSQWTVEDTISFFETYGIEGKEKTLGQLFPVSDSAKDFVKVFTDLCEGLEQVIWCEAEVKSVEIVDNGFTVSLERNGEIETLFTPKVVIASGGLPIPKMGATGLAYDMARQFGLRVTALRPGLVPLTFTGPDLAMMQPLAGVSLETEITCGRAEFREAVLFTHRGLSGPAVLQIASCWQSGPIALNLLPGRDAAAFLLERKQTRPRAELRTVLAETMPQRLADSLAAAWPAATSGEAATPRMADLPDRVLRAFAERLACWSLSPSGTEGYAKAEVTCGGVDTRDLSSRTMAATAVPGLFVIGEAVDVTGWLGGYNFQWAWASGWCAGEVA